MASIKLPYMDTSAIQRGLSDLGSAIRYQQDKSDALAAKADAARGDQEWADANLSLAKTYDDNIAGFQKDGVVASDVKDQFRSQSGTWVDQSASGITDPGLRQKWITAQKAAMESHAADFNTKYIEQEAQKTSLISAQKVNDAVKTADPEALNRIFQPVYDTTDGVTITGFGPQTKLLFKSDVDAFNAYQKAVDDIAGGRLGKIISTAGIGQDGNLTTWSDRVGALENARKELDRVLSGVPATTDTKTRLAGELDKQILEAKKQAQMQQVHSEMSQVGSLGRAMTDAYLAARSSGGRYDPSKDPNVTALMNSLTTPEAKDALDALKRKNLVEPDKVASSTLSDAAEKKQKANATDTVLNAAKELMDRGATPEQAKAAVAKMQVWGLVSYDEVAVKIDSMKRFSENKDLLAATDAAFKAEKLPEALTRQLQQNIAAVVGGFTTNSRGSAYLDTSGAINIPKVEALAKEMAKGAAADWMSKIVNENTPKVIDDTDAVKLSQALAKGAGLGHFSPGTIDANSEFIAYKNKMIELGNKQLLTQANQSGGYGSFQVVVNKDDKLGFIRLQKWPCGQFYELDNNAKLVMVK